MAISDEEVGYVVWGTPSVVARRYVGGRWSVTQNGVDRPAQSRLMMEIFKGYVNFPAFDGHKELLELEKRTGGTAIIHPVVSDPTMVV